MHQFYLSQSNINLATIFMLKTNLIGSMLGSACLMFVTVVARHSAAARTSQEPVNAHPK
jgi:hypothetical protein